MSWSATADEYLEVLGEFKERFNTNPRAQKLVKRWNRMILLDSTDTPNRKGLIIQDRVLTDVIDVGQVDEDRDDVVLLKAEEAILQQVFSGKYNPATALTDGALSVFSRDRDKVKLEALAMVIWRLG